MPSFIDPGTYYRSSISDEVVIWGGLLFIFLSFVLAIKILFIHQGKNKLWATCILATGVVFFGTLLVRWMLPPPFIP